MPEEEKTEKRVGNRGRHILIHTDVDHVDYLKYFNSRVPFIYHVNPTVMDLV